MSDFTLDTREFSKALQFVVKATGKDGADVLNRAALHAVIGGKGVRGAMQRTPKADKTKIRALPMAYFAAAVKRRGGKMTAKQEQARRIRAAGYTAFAGWSKAAKALGGKGVKGVQSGFNRSMARKGFGTKAKPSNLESVIANTAPAAEKIGFAPLQAAINDVARDMVQYATKKMQQTFKKASAK